MQEEDYPDLVMQRISSIKQPQVPNWPIITQEVFKAQHYSKQGNKYLNEYQLFQTIGQGSYGKVKRVERSYLDKNGQQSKSIYAMKIYDRTLLGKRRFYGPNLQMINAEEALENQLNIIKTLDHKNIIAFYQIIDDYDKDKVYLVMDYCDLGQFMNYSQLSLNYEVNPKVLHYLQQAYNMETHHREEYAKILFRQVVQALLYLHERNITHRDIKIDNILIKSGIPGNEIKLSDFSTVRYSDSDVSYQTLGSSYYKAPEQQFATEKGYSAKACDIWSLGVTMYIFCFDKFPFTGDSDLELEIKSLNDQIEYPTGASQELVRLLKGMTMKDPSLRPKISDVLSDQWFKSKHI